tara:strand:+ start:1526 stop:2755 length:1230 start_codon:yes stop_codon:yes gene_type:complete
MKTVEIREARTALIEEEKKIYAKAQAESERAFTGEELERIEKIENDLRELDHQYMQARDEEAKSQVADRMREPVQPTGERDIAAAVGNQLPAGSLEGRFFRDMVEGRTTQDLTTLAGLVPKPLMSEVSMLLDRVSAMRQVSKVASVGSAMRIPRMTGYGSAVSATAEAATFGAVDPSFGEIDTSTKIVKGAGLVDITNEMLHDGQFDIESLCIQTIAEAIGHFQENEFLNGDGTGNPEGLFKGAASGAAWDWTAANVYDTTVQPGSLTCAKVTEALLTKMPPQYMGLPRSLVLGQAAAAALLSDVDGGSGTGRLLLQQSANATFANMPSMSILGTQIIISSAAATGTIADGAMYGAIVTDGSYHIHDLGGLYVQPDPYSQAASGIKRITAYQRSAGMVVRPESVVPLIA